MVTSQEGLSFCRRWSTRSSGQELGAETEKAPSEHTSQGGLFADGRRGGIRTRDLWLRRPTLYPAELPVHKRKCHDKREANIHQSSGGARYYEIRPTIISRSTQRHAHPPGRRLAREQMWSHHLARSRDSQMFSHFPPNTPVERPRQPFFRHPQDKIARPTSGCKITAICSRGRLTSAGIFCIQQSLHFIRSSLMLL